MRIKCSVWCSWKLAWDGHRCEVIEVIERWEKGLPTRANHEPSLLPLQG
jgi:hypothetical protein